MISLRRFTRLQADAKYQRQVALTAKRVGRAGQISRSSVETGDGTASVGDLLADAPTVAETVEDHVADLETLDPGLDVFDDTQETEDAAHQADMAAIGANLVVTEALDAAEDAAELALEAKVTADGRNRIYAQAINPVASPDFPFVNGDLWYRTEVIGGVTRFVEVFMWNGTEWKPYQMVASSLLVPGTVGPTLIENGAITTGKLAATAIDGMTITGSTIRTAASGQRFVMHAAGIEGYDAGGVRQFTMTPDAAGLRFMPNTGSNIALYGPSAMSISGPSAIDPSRVNWFSAGQQSSILRSRLTTGPSAYVEDRVNSQLAMSGGVSLGVERYTASGATTSTKGIQLSVGATLPTLTFVDGAAISEVRFSGGKLVFNGPVEFEGDTDGWVDITTSAMLSTFRGSLKYQIKNGTVTLHVKTNNTGTLPNGQTTVATLPSALFPHDLLVQAAYMSSNTIGMLLLNAAGAVVFMNTSGANRVTGTALISYPI